VGSNPAAATFLINYFLHKKSFVCNMLNIVQKGIAYNYLFDEIFKNCFFSSYSIIRNTFKESNYN
jgi:hypothetical protein